MNTFKLGCASILAASTMTVVGAASQPAEAGPSTCPMTPGKNSGASVSNEFAVNGVNIRSGPKTTCASLGQGQKGQGANLCCSYGTTSGVWQYLKDKATGVKGWSRIDNLNFYTPSSVCYLDT